MDKNTITGLVLIGILLVGFSFLSRPSEEQIAAQKRYATKGKEAFTTIQNNLVEITLDNKGGRVYSALLKNYMGQDKKPVVLFNGSDASMNFNFYNKKGALQTKDFYFEAVNKTDSSVTMRLAADSASYIDFIYTLKPDNYLMSFVIKATGMDGKLAASTNYVDISWSQRARQIEKGYTYENRLADLTYKYTGDDVDNLSASKDDEKSVSERLDWIAFKKWELNNLVYLGWPLIRWINKWITINVFDWLSGWGLSMGIVLLLLTIMVKIVVFPATWKTYMSSAKMRLLKPKIDEINKKYPKQEDAMKKQQEVMGLYSQYGVSPMGGCLPMLLQFPILMALFMFVPSAIELRQQSFLWADDLSTYDAFITFPFHIPFLGNHLSLFCLLMTVTNILNTKYTMQQQDTGAQPQMAAMKWMMYLMPIMFLFVLNDYPSGLNYYYFISTLISVVTMIILRRTTDENKLLTELEAKKKDPKQMKKTGFAARLEAMQKQQEQLAKERANKQNKK